MARSGGRELESPHALRRDASPFVRALRVICVACVLGLLRLRDGGEPASARLAGDGRRGERAGLAERSSLLRATSPAAAGRNAGRRFRSRLPRMCGRRLASASASAPASGWRRRLPFFMHPGARRGAPLHVAAAHVRLRERCDGGVEVQARARGRRPAVLLSLTASRVVGPGPVRTFRSRPRRRARGMARSSTSPRGPAPLPAPGAPRSRSRLRRPHPRRPR
jgi:hypothetical protein